MSEISARRSALRVSFDLDQERAVIGEMMSDYADLPDILEQVPLADFPPAHYAVRVSLAKAGAEIVAAAEEFDLSFAETVPRPWFSSRILPAPGDPVYEEITGSQLWRELKLLNQLGVTRGQLGAQTRS